MWQILQQKKKLKKLLTRKNFLLGLLTTFKVIATVIFKKMQWKHYKNGIGPWFDTFMQKDTLLLRQITIWIKSLNLLIFDLFKHRPSRHGRSSSAKHKRNLVVMIWNHVCLSPPVGLVSLNRVGFDIYAPIQKSITNR